MELTLNRTLNRAAAPTITREGIRWRALGPILEISIDLHNDSDMPVEGGQLVIEVAAFGAFVPFEPLTRNAVSGFAPRERRTVTTIVPIDRVPRPQFQKSMRSWWAGNLNVYFDRCPENAVEVHRALDLRVGARTRTHFMFFLLSPGACSGELRISNPAWSAEILALGSGGDRGAAFLLVESPDPIGDRARTEAIFTRESDGKVVTVEFEFVTVKGAGDTLGCVKA